MTTPSNEKAQAQYEKAVEHTGGPARLLSGPGTGKTYALTQRVIRLTKDLAVLPTDILALTFTRAAAQELAQRVRDGIGPDAVPPRVRTLHSFALSQLLANSSKIDALPQPLRIADDWDEDQIVVSDLRDTLKIKKSEVKDLFGSLASNWETLNAEQSGWEAGFPNAQFIGAWRQHRDLYGYTLRDELVYQLKQALSYVSDLEIDGPAAHLLVDEYQDLNPCDLAVVEHLATSGGAELYVAGDDDQSIYGFRNAYPLGIRQFVESHLGAADLRMEICRRCDPEILKFSDFVIQQEVGREPKDVQAEDGKDQGFVGLKQFEDQYAEADEVARIAAKAVSDGTPPSEIMILLRSDRNGAFSKVLITALRARELPVHVDVGGDGPFDVRSGRQLLSLLRLVADNSDSLALRSLLQLDKNGLGSTAISAVEASALAAGHRFAGTMHANRTSEQVGDKSAKLRDYTNELLDEVAQLAQSLDVSGTHPDDRATDFVKRIRAIAPPKRIRAEDWPDFASAIEEFARISESNSADSVTSVVQALGSSKDDEEPVVDPTAINILSMHKAKGLGADIVFIVAAEDEYLPGRATSDLGINEERRLLYVSMTRAKHQLFITGCKKRKHQQRRTGSAKNTERRTLTRFLRDAPLPNF